MPSCPPAAQMGDAGDNDQRVDEKLWDDEVRGAAHAQRKIHDGRHAHRKIHEGRAELMRGQTVERGAAWTGMGEGRVRQTHTRRQIAWGMGGQNAWEADLNGGRGRLIVQCGRHCRGEGNRDTRPQSALFILSPYIESVSIFLSTREGTWDMQGRSHFCVVWLAGKNSWGPK